MCITDYISCLRSLSAAAELISREASQPMQANGEASDTAQTMAEKQRWSVSLANAMRKSAVFGFD